MSKIPVLFEIMKQRGITAKKLSADTQISTGNISDWKSGRSKPSAEKLSILAKYFDVSVDFLLGNETKEESTFDEITIVKNTLWGTTDGITDEMLEEVKWYARVLVEREKAKREANPQIEITVRQASRDGRPIQTTNLTPQELEQREAAPLIPEEF